MLLAPRFRRLHYGGEQGVQVRNPPGLLDNERYVDHERILQIIDSMETPAGMQAGTHVKLCSSIIARDALEMGLDLVELQPARVERIIHSVARHIGLKTVLASEEEEGKIFHEYRSRFIGGRPVGADAMAIFDFLAPRWGGTDDEVTYFGALDTTALYLILVDEYVRRHGDGILDEEFLHHRSGDTMRIIDTVVSAAEFYVRKREESSLGLIESVRLNKEFGFWFQTTQESCDALLLPNGDLPNIDAKIAFFEIQVVARRALRSASNLLRVGRLHEQWRAEAEMLFECMVREFWDIDTGRFARAIHRDANGRPERIFMDDTAAAQVLRHDPFSTATDSERRRYTASVIMPLYTDLVTEAGFRTQSMRYADFTGYWSYAGPHAVIPAATKRIADGLHQLGFQELGRDADQRFIAACEAVRGFPDIHFVDDDGHLLFHVGEDRVPSTAEIISATAAPSVQQGWTATAALIVVDRPIVDRLRPRWQLDLIDGVREQLREREKLSQEQWPEETSNTRQRWFDAVSAQQSEEAFVRRAGRTRNSAIVPLRRPKGSDE